MLATDARTRAGNKANEAGDKALVFSVIAGRELSSVVRTSRGFSQYIFIDD